MKHSSQFARVPRPLVLAVVLLLSSGIAFGQGAQTSCEREADARLNEMWTAASIASSLTYTRLMERALYCMRVGPCSKPEALVHIQEMMVDEQVIQLQRKKLAVLKTFAGQAGRFVGACDVAAMLPSFTEQLGALNAQQLARIEDLAAQYYPAAPAN
jgi:hypothetical protein